MRNLGLVGVMVLVGCGSDPEVAPDAPPPDAGSALPPGVTAFAGTDSALPSNDDLAPLFALVGDAAYIGVGESVHTSGGYYAMKDRFIRTANAEPPGTTCASCVVSASAVIHAGPRARRGTGPRRRSGARRRGTGTSCRTAGGSA